MFVRIPTSFVPEEDQGVLMAMVQLPAGATMERTREVINQLSDYFIDEEKENVESIMGIVGFSFAGSGQNAGMAFIKLKDWKERKRNDQHVRQIVQRAFPRLMGIREGLVFAFNLPAIPELGTAAGFDMFNDMIQSIKVDTARLMLHVRIEQKVEREQVAKVTGTNKDDSGPRTPKKRETKKIYPNDPCPCGSGKKYKLCHGRGKV